MIYYRANYTGRNYLSHMKSYLTRTKIDNKYHVANNKASSTFDYVF
jgi:hypothetical protein